MWNQSCNICQLSISDTFTKQQLKIELIKGNLVNCYYLDLVIICMLTNITTTVNMPKRECLSQFEMQEITHFAISKILNRSKTVIFNY